LPVLSGRRDWLSITPEPERVLPRAVATLRAGGPPSKGEVERERERAEKLVLHGSRNSWLAWLEDIEALARRAGAEAGEPSEQLEAARREALAVIRNHNALMLGLQGRVAEAAARAQEEAENE
jgi:hypothetical protein